MGTRGTADYVYHSTNTDAVSEKLGKAGYLKFSENTITMKDEYGKTVGMVRDITSAKTFQDKQFKRMFDLNQQFKKAGVPLMGIHDVGLSFKDIRVKDGQVYIFNNVNSDEQLNSTDKKAWYFKKSAAKAVAKNEYLRKAEQAGFIVVNYNKVG